MAQSPTTLAMLEGTPPALNNPYFTPSDHELTGGLPMNLESLRDGPPGTKPFYPYSTLIRYAIKGSPNQRLLLEDIYYAIESRFPYFRSAPGGWKNSVRHNLSLNPCFEKVPRPLSDRGKGSYWTVNDNVDPRTGVHRIRTKKGRGRRSPTESRQTEAIPELPGGEHRFVGPSQPLPTDENGQIRAPAPPFPFPPPFPDPNLMMGRFPPLFPEEQPELDANGQPDWKSLWMKELGHLHQLTAEQEKAGVDQEWYRIMIWRIRSALLPLLNPDEAVMVHPGLVGPPPELQQTVQGGDG